jgi:hypothetical protein
LNEGVLIHHRATGSVYDDDAILHLLELGLADDVSGVFLPSLAGYSFK